MDGGFEGLAYVCLHVDLHYLPSFSSTLNEGALLGDRLVTVHVKVDLFCSWIAVVTEDYLFSGLHGFDLCQIRRGWWPIVRGILGCILAPECARNPTGRVPAVYLTHAILAFLTIPT